MKQGWEMKRLNEISENLDSRRIPITKTIRSEGSIPYYGASGIVDYVSDYIFDEDLLCVSEDGANLLARTYPIAFSISGKTWVNNHAHVLRFKDFTTQKFVELYLNSIKLDAFVSGMAQPKLNQAMLNKIPIPLPPLAEQQRIVSILEKAFAAIDKAKANAERNLQNARELFESYLTGVFEQKGEGWEEKRLGDTCIVERGSSPRPIEKYQTDSPDGVNWIKIGDTKGVDKYIYFTKEKITREGAEKSRYVKEGDFILSNSMSFGKPYIMKTDGYIHDGWFVLRLPNYLDKDYFYYLLTSPNVQKQIQSLGAGAIVKNISGDLVKKVDVFFPKSKEQQQSIVHQLDALRVKIQQLEAAYRQKITDLEEMKKSILQKAFNGELKTS